MYTIVHLRTGEPFPKWFRSYPYNEKGKARALGFIREVEGNPEHHLRDPERFKEEHEIDAFGETHAELDYWLVILNPELPKNEWGTVCP